MQRRVVCEKCKSILEYDDRSVYEGNRDWEDVNCPVCDNKVGAVFTDLIINVRIIKNGEDK